VGRVLGNRYRGNDRGSDKGVQSESEMIFLGRNKG
jgi:hypothetical protein